MTMLPPFLPQSIRYGQNAFPDVEPFSLRAAASYEEIQYSVVTWIRDQLLPWMTDNGYASTWATDLVDQVNAALAAEAADYAARYGQFFQGTLVAPPATGVTATDTANLQAAFTAAQARSADLILTPATDGSVAAYSCNAPLAWSLSKGSIVGDGHVGIDFSPVPSTYTGAALTLSGEGGVFTRGAHLGVTHQLTKFFISGHDNDTSTMDGLKFDDPAGNIDQSSVRSVKVYGFRDGITFGSNTWSIDFNRVSVANAHRYGLNLSHGTNSGEAFQFTASTIYGCHNAAGTAAAIWAPALMSTDFRMIGGSLDYNDLEGKIEGGSITFNMVHIEDKNIGPMFTYQNAVAGNVMNVTFTDCLTASTATAFRDHIHEIMPSTDDRIMVNFVRGKGAVPTGGHWVQDNSGLASSAMSVTYDNTDVDSNYGTLPGVLLLAPFGTIGQNTRFDSAATFVANGVNGWTAGTVDTWTIGAANARAGSCLQLVGTGASGANNTFQKIRIPSNRRPIRVSGYQQVTAYTAGSVGLYVRFYAEDGTTQIGTDLRLGTDLSAASGWVGKTRRFTPPAGSAFIQVMANAATFQGTAQWDDIEIVPL